MLLRLENSALSIQILEQQGTEKQAMKQVRALYENLPCFHCGIQPWLSKVSGYAGLSLASSPPNRFYPCVMLYDREEHDKALFEKD